MYEILLIVKSKPQPGQPAFSKGHVFYTLLDTADTESEMQTLAKKHIREKGIARIKVMKCVDVRTTITIKD